MANIYCRGSKLTKEIFEIVLRCFLDGQSSSEALEKIQQKFPADSPTEVKTISRHYDRIGLYLFEQKFGNRWHAENPHIFALQKTDKAEYMAKLDKFVDEYHFSAIDPDNKAISHPLDEDGRPWAESEAAGEYREFSRKRFGVRMRSRGHLGLAVYRAEYSSRPEGTYIKKTLTPSDFERLFENLKKMMCKQRC